MTTATPAATLQATYAKLRDGSWGVRLVTSRTVTPGEIVTVTTRAGAVKTETISRVLWTGNGVTLATIERREARDSYGYSVRSGASYQAGITAPQGRRCPQCGSRECSRAWSPTDQCDED